ncbi:hypothetical protein Tco_1137944, partial [Tanacetum coccineum]
MNGQTVLTLVNVVIVPAGRYVVPTGRVKVPAGRYVVPIGKDNVIVSVGRTKVIPAGCDNTYLSLKRSLRRKDLSRAPNNIKRLLNPTIQDDGEPQNEGPNKGEGATTEEPVVEYFYTFPTKDELTYHSWIMRRKLDPRENTNGGVSNFTGRIKGMHIFIGNFTYIIDFMIVEDISSIIDHRLSQAVLGRPFVEMSNMIHDPPE